jgi:hypothetical protein
MDVQFSSPALRPFRVARHKLQVWSTHIRAESIILALPRGSNESSLTRCTAAESFYQEWAEPSSDQYSC